MDGFLATVMTGIIGALVGAIAAYYLGGVREKQKRILESQRHDQERLEEERQKQYERRNEALDELRGQAYSVSEAMKAWAREIKNAGSSEKGEGVESSVTIMGNISEALNAPIIFRDNIESDLKALSYFEQTGVEIEKRMASLRGRYHVHKPYLGVKANKIFNSFEVAFEERHHQILAPLTRWRNSLLQLHPLAASTAKEWEHKLGGITNLLNTASSIRQIALNQRLFKEAEIISEGLVKSRDELKESIELALRWNSKTYIDALETESKSVSSMNRNQSEA